MIQSFKGKFADGIWRRRFVKGFPADLAGIAYRKLAMIEAAMVLQDLRLPPGNRLEALKGDRKGQHSIRINDQWRVCFRWSEDRAYDVEITDYH